MTEKQLKEFLKERTKKELAEEVSIKAQSFLKAFNNLYEFLKNNHYVDPHKDNISRKYGTQRGKLNE